MIKQTYPFLRMHGIVRNGLPQGLDTGPLLFLIPGNNLPKFKPTLSTDKYAKVNVIAQQNCLI